MSKEVNYNNEKKKKYVVVICLLVLMICVTGSTYAYFALTASNNTITGTVGGGSLSLTVSKVLPLDNDNNMIPQLESALGDAISDTYNCVDGNGNVVCQVYSATVTNVGSISSELNGTIKFEGTSNMPNLKWKRITDSRTIGEYSSSTASTSEALFEEGKVFNANETATYYFVIWIDETEEVQTDSGTFRAIINFNSATGGLTSTVRPRELSAVVKKLLVDNPVQETKTNMFNYTNDGKYDCTFNWDTREYDICEYDSDYVTNGMYVMEDEDGLSYYFRGNVDNLVQFGEYEEDVYAEVGAKYVFEEMGEIYEYTYDTLDSCINDVGIEKCTVITGLKYSAGTPMYWRVVRINGDGTLRLIYSGASKYATGEDLTIGDSLYNCDGDSINCGDIKYVGYTYDNGNDSIIKKEVDTWYTNVLGGSSYDQYVINGRFCNDTSGYSDGVDNGYFDAGSRTTSPILTCPKTTETFGGSYILKAGLITMDELVLGGNRPNTTVDNYLYSSVGYWTMTPVDFSEMYFPRMFVFEEGLSDSFEYILNVRPVINVDTTNLTLSGSGSTTAPYVLQPK